MTTDDDRRRKPLPGAPQATPLPKRFYAAVTTGPLEDAGAAILLDGRCARTPGKRELRLPALPLAHAVAGEWAAQDERIDPARMPLTRLGNTAIDGVALRLEDVRADVVKYAASDLLCYRAERPDGLVRRQAEHWDPVLAWAASTLGARMTVGTGIVHVAQPPESLDAIAAGVRPLDAFRLTALHTIMTLTGSSLLALAVLHRSLTPDQAWSAAHVDEDWQIAEWGADAEAEARRALRHVEMGAAARMLALLGPAAA
jgi:chaperone required for assembly of F1-ATPase